MKLSIEINGMNNSDLLSALQEVTRLIEDDFTSGRDENTTSKFSFNIEGEEAAYFIQARHFDGVDVDDLNEDHLMDSFDDVRDEAVSEEDGSDVVVFLDSDKREFYRYKLN